MSTKGFMKGATFGAVIGTAVALLLAPKAGKKTRAETKKIVKELAGKIERETARLGGVAEISQKTYQTLVQKTVAEYGRGKKGAEALINDLAAILHGYWNEVRQEVMAKPDEPKKIRKKKND